MNPRLAGVRIGLVGPLPPPAGGMANQTRQLAALLEQEGMRVDVVVVNAPYRPAWIGRVKGVRALFRLAPYLWALWRVAGRARLLHVMANSGWSWHLFAAPAIWIAYLRGVPVVVNYQGGEAAAFLRRSSRWIKPTLRRAAALVVPSDFLRQVFSRYSVQARIVPNIIDLKRFQPVQRCPTIAPHLIVTRNLGAYLRYSDRVAGLSEGARHLAASAFDHRRLRPAGKRTAPTDRRAGFDSRRNLYRSPG